ncbi:MAG: DUF362 domain-containing protein [Syntrophomonadaceae bacterium]|nr:DUF362 domain-containing protein [Syntrophomonadaceae bacterium]
MAKTKVSVVRTAQGPSREEIRRSVREAVALAGGLEGIINPGNLVIIKPNLVAVPKEPRSGAVTNPEVCRALADMVREMGARPVIADSAAAGVDTEKVIACEGYQELRADGYEVIDLKKTPRVTMSIPGGMAISEFETFELVREADVIISVPVMKTHDQTQASLSMKNLKGLGTDNDKKHMHSVGIFEGVSDIIQLFKPAFTVVDAIYCQEGLGPVFGIPVEMDLILAGRDLVAVDTVCSKIMGFEPEELLITANAANRGLGTMNMEEIEVVGCSIPEVYRRFKRSSEDVIVDVQDFHLLFEEGTCTGCHNTVLSSIVDIKNDGNQDYLPGKWVVAGLLNEESLPAGVAKENLVLVGKCTKLWAEQGIYVKGCPPNNIWVVHAICGDEVKRRYATEDIED